MALSQTPSVDRIPGALNETPSVIYRTDPGTGVAVFKVFAEKPATLLDRQALLKMVNLADQTAIWHTTEDTSQGAFTNIPFGNYDVEISAVGYLSAHQLVRASNSQLQQFEVVLHHDPSALNLDLEDRALPPKARREMKSAVAALKSRRFKDAQKHLEGAYRAAPSSAQVTFLLGYSNFQQSDYEKASSYLSTSTKLRPHDEQALTLLGRAYLERKDYSAAQLALEEASAIDADSWLPRDLLADAYFHQKNYAKARDEAQIAIEKGKAEANPARLVLGEALINLGLDEQGIQTLETFLQQSPSHPMAGQVRSMIADVREHASSASITGNEAKAGMKLAGVDPLQALAGPALSIKSWQPPGIDQIKLALASGSSARQKKWRKKRESTSGNW